jgi:hypothetical protein
MVMDKKLSKKVNTFIMDKNLREKVNRFIQVEQEKLLEISLDVASRLPFDISNDEALNELNQLFYQMNNHITRLQTYCEVAKKIKSKD